MQAAPEAHPLAISTPFSSASLHRFEDGLQRLGMCYHFEPLVQGALQSGIGLDDALFRIREDFLAAEGSAGVEHLPSECGGLAG